MKIILACLSLVGFVPATQADDFEVFLGGSVRTANVFSNALETAPDGVGQLWGSVSRGGRCNMSFWVNYGLSTDVGDEFDIGPVCNFGLSEDITLQLALQRYITKDFADATELRGTLTIGKTDMTVARYAWEGIEDVTRLQIGRSVDVSELSESLSAKGKITYESGFGVKDTVVLGADVGYKFSDFVSAFATGYHVLKKSGINDDTVVLGLNFSF